MKPGWSVLIIASRESLEALTGTIQAARAASDDSTEIDVIVNGNRALADAVSGCAAQLGKNLRIWFVPARDKAHAWNEFVRHVWNGSEFVFCLDGYVRAMPDAFRLLAETLARDKKALCASAVPTQGWSAEALRKEMTSERGLHGNLFAVRGETLCALRERRFRLPLGLYRTDAFLGAVIAFNLEPAAHSWDAGRIAIQRSATWRVHPRGMASRLIEAFRRKLRQAQGRLEIAAVREHLAVERRAPEQLPRTAADLVAAWMERHPSEARMRFLRDPVSYLAARRLLAPRDWTSADQAPLLLHQTG